MVTKILICDLEVTTEDGTVLWSKLKQPDGRNNFPHVFPTSETLVKNYRKFLGKSEDDEIVTLPKTVIYEKEGTRVGVW